MCPTITRSSRHPRHQTPEQSPAHRVIYVTDNAGNARRGVTFSMTWVTWKGVCVIARVTPLCSSGSREAPLSDAGDARRGYLLPPYLLINGSSVTRTPSEALPSERLPFASSTSPILGAPARKCPVLAKPRARKDRRS